MPFLLGSEEHTSELQSPCNLVCRFFFDRKSTRLNSSHLVISYAVFCLKKKITASVAFGQTTRVARLTQNASTQELEDTATVLREAGDVQQFSIDFFFFLMTGEPPRSPLFPSPTLFR